MDEDDRLWAQFLECQRVLRRLTQDDHDPGLGKEMLDTSRLLESLLQQLGVEVPGRLRGQL